MLPGDAFAMAQRNFHFDAARSHLFRPGDGAALG
jgi:hypothetical protein